MKRLIYLVSAVTLVVFSSCRKEEPAPVPSTPTPTSGGSSSIGSFFQNNGVPLQSFTINTGNWEMVTGTSGTIIYINPNSFVTQSGQPVTGSVQIELREIFSKKDMILSNAPTTSGGKPLISGGEIYFAAKQNNQKLKLASGSYVYAQVPAGLNPSNQMMEFYTSSLSATNDWDTASTAPIPVFQDSSNTQNYYSFQVDSTNWINCDYFYTSTGPTSTVWATVGSSFDTSNCFVFVSFNGQNSAAHCYSYTNHIFSPGSYYTLPVGMSVTFVAISEQNGQYYSAFKSAVITTNHNETLTLTATTLPQIKQALANLP